MRADQHHNAPTKQERLKSLDKHYLVTVTDLTHTRHFKIPKMLKKLSLVSIALVSLAVGGTYYAMNSQQSLLVSVQEKTKILAHQVIGAYRKNADLTTVLDQHAGELEGISTALSDVEANTGVSGDADRSILERLQAIAAYYQEKDSSYAELNELVGEISKQNESSSSDSLETSPEAISLTRLTPGQERFLRTSIPSGFPTTKSEVTSNFGNRTHPISRQKAFHSGIDLRAQMKTPIYATADGIVESASANSSSGKQIIIRHNYGFETRFAHLDSYKVAAGDIIQKGDLIAYSGNTGRSSAPHLHYEVRYLDKAKNPIDFLEWGIGSRKIFAQTKGIQWQSLLAQVNRQIISSTLQLSQVDQSIDGQTKTR